MVGQNNMLHFEVINLVGGMNKSVVHTLNEFTLSQSNGIPQIMQIERILHTQIERLTISLLLISNFL